MKRYDDVVHPSSGYGCGIFEWIHILFVAIVFAGILNGAVFQVVTVEQYSMEPTLYEGNRVYMSKCSYWFSSPEFGDIIIFYNESSNSNYVKRIIGEPGDEILIDGYNVYRNGILLDEPYINEPTNGYFSIVVPEGKYFWSWR